MTLLPRIDRSKLTSAGIVRLLLFCPLVIESESEMVSSAMTPFFWRCLAWFMVRALDDLKQHSRVATCTSDKL